MCGKDNFTIVSFDNLDKNFSNAAVTAGKDRSGFHGTTVQIVEPLPLSQYDTVNHVPDISTSNGSIEEVSKRSRSRTIASDIIEAVYNPPSVVKVSSICRQNRFSELSETLFQLSEFEDQAWRLLHTDVMKYIMSKVTIQDIGPVPIIIPGLKHFLLLSSATDQTEKSTIDYLTVLDKSADSKDTVLHVLNLLHGKYNIGSNVEHVVVVGDGKSYDYMVKLKCEYEDGLSWLLPFPGDWHILKNTQPMLMKVYFDAGLRELAILYHAGATLKVLETSSKFKLTHRFLINVWEAMYRHQVHSFLELHNAQSSHSQPAQSYTFVETLKQKITTALPQSPVHVTSANDNQTWKVVSNCQEEASVQLRGLEKDFVEWRVSSGDKNDTFQFWDRFLHMDFMAYVALYLGIRFRDWNLRMTGLKLLAPLFHALDRQNYLKLIPYHVADLETFPVSILNNLKAGAFAVSVTGKYGFSVACDEAHEMCINSEIKQAMNSSSQESLLSMTYYLPYRARALQNIKEQLMLDNTDSTLTSKPASAAEEATVQGYMDKLKLSTLFNSSQPSQLHHIFTEKDASAEQAADLLHFREIGEGDLVDYINAIILRLPGSKLPARRQRKLKTFALQKVTIFKQKQELDDRKLVIACLKKQITHSKQTGQPISHLDLDQLVKFPRALASADGKQEKGQKSCIFNNLKSAYCDAFLSEIPSQFSNICVILEGMFLINTAPLSIHKTFGEYALFLYKRWVVKSHTSYSAIEIHIIFDHP